MGNSWIKNFDITKKPHCTAGTNGLWKIHNARRNGQDYSVFIFDKRTLDKITKNATEKGMIMNLLRKEGQKLSQLRHPHILALAEPPAEDAKRFVFVTEQIKCTLNQSIQSETPGSTSILDIKLIILQIIEGLSFLHNDAKLMHLNLSPDNILLTVDGKYKIFGLFHTAQSVFSQLQEVDIDFAPKPYDNQLALSPNLSYCAPELACHPHQACYQSDVFSLGLILIGLVRYQISAMKDLTFLQISSASQYQMSFECLHPFIKKSSFYQAISDQNLRQLLEKMLHKDPKERPSIVEIYHSEFFMDPLIRLLHSLRQLNLFDEEQQAALLKQISRNILKVRTEVKQFERLVIVKDILPQILPHILKEKLMTPTVFIAVDISRSNEPLLVEKFLSLCWPQMKKVSQLQSIPAQTLYCLVQNINLFYEVKVPPQDIQAHLIPLYVKCFESDVAKLQEVALQQTEVVIQKIDYQYSKVKILPRLLFLCIESKNEDLNLLALQVLSRTYRMFDTNSIADNILPTLEKLRKAKNPTKQQAAILLEIYQNFAESLNSDQVALKLIPQLMPYIVEAKIGKVLIKQYSDLLINLITCITNEKLKLFGNEALDQEGQSHQAEEVGKQVLNNNPTGGHPAEIQIEQGLKNQAQLPQQSPQLSNQQQQFGLWTETSLQVNQGQLGSPEGVVMGQPVYAFEGWNPGDQQLHSATEAQKSGANFEQQPASQSQGQSTQFSVEQAQTVDQALQYQIQRQPALENQNQQQQWIQKESGFEVKQELSQANNNIWPPQEQQYQQWHQQQLGQVKPASSISQHLNDRYKELMDLDLMTFDMNSNLIVAQTQADSQKQGIPNVNLNYDPFLNWGSFNNKSQ